MVALRSQPAQHQSAQGSDRALRGLRRGCAAATSDLFVSATNVLSGELRVFPRNEMTAEVVMASACLPLLFHAVEIDGVPYWDGGYSGNPALFPFSQADVEPRMC